MFSFVWSCDKNTDISIHGCLVIARVSCVVFTFKVSLHVSAQWRDKIFHKKTENWGDLKLWYRLYTIWDVFILQTKPRLYKAKLPGRIMLSDSFNSWCVEGGMRSVLAEGADAVILGWEQTFIIHSVWKSLLDVGVNFISAPKGCRSLKKKLI